MLLRWTLLLVCLGVSSCLIGGKMPIRCLVTSATSTSSPSISNGEVIGVIIVDHGSKREEANQNLLEVVRRYRAIQSTFTIVEPAHMELAAPSIEDAFRRCVEQGATNVVCHPYFLSYGRHVREDVPALMASAAEKFPGVRYSITEPLGMQENLSALIHSSIMGSMSSKSS